MVPHIRIEEKLHELADATEQVFAVTAVPDEKKGERIIVLHTLSEAALTAVFDKLSRCDLPALWKPKANQFVYVDSIPTLGTGKMDLRAIRAFAVSAAVQTEVETSA
jgi:acyl-[acyl-carrier-protein]-phospholipid O-acyltransferase/long-chain-fatty-acid--[acyl-carrier-protein] ligase